MVDVYRHVLESCDHESLYRLPHFGMPGHTLHKSTEVEDKRCSRAFPYICMQPLPFLPPAKVSRKGE
jgi:hypothetical protein